MKPAIQRESYRDQLLRLTQAFAGARSEEVIADLSSDSQPLGVKLFIDGNLDKRFQKLSDGLEFVAPAFRNFDDLIVAYVKAIPLAAYDTGASDSERMLRWLEGTRRLTPRQQDCIACQRARHAVEDAARHARLAYVHFQERWSVTRALVDRLRDGRVRLYLNPIRVETTLCTSTFLGDDADLPAQVVFFPIAGEISSAALEPQGRALVEELISLEPISFPAWAACTEHADEEELLETVRDLAAMGLVAVA